MEKNWLIRTKSNHILGPVSKEKVVELYQNGSLKPDDELCSGNGFWFYIREDDMVARFVTGSEVQGFNPISEAKDVLTQGTSPGGEMVPEKDDITLVGGIPLSKLKVEDAPPPPIELPLEEAKKKNEVIRAPRRTELDLEKQAPKRGTSAPRPQVLVKKQEYMKWLGLVAFITLFMMVYFRKRIIRALINEDELTKIELSLFSSAHAQASLEVGKKKLLDRTVKLDQVKFGLEAGLQGLRVRSDFDINAFSCKDLNSPTHQLAVVLYPAELINEKFLIKTRDCVSKLTDAHPLKRWMKTTFESETRTKEEQESIRFLSEILNTQFNLITDPQMRTKIIHHLFEIKNKTLGERLLSSYLYLIIGNVSRSDKLLLEFVNRPPYANWQGWTSSPGIYDHLAEENLKEIVNKLSNHPSDRKSWQLFVKYLMAFYKSEPLITLVSGSGDDRIEGRLKYRIIERYAPELVHHLRLLELSENRRLLKLKDQKSFPKEEQAYWDWPFFDITPLVSMEMVEYLQKIEKEDPLWFIYLMDNDKMLDAYAKKTGKSFMHGRRQFLREQLKHSHLFMLTLYKLIEFGDINETLVSDVVRFLEND